MADRSRPAADRARDAARKPAETLAFAGVKTGDKVLELAPGRGYYTRLLAKAVGPTGKVYALVPAPMAKIPGMMESINAVVQTNPNVYVLLVPDLATFVLPERCDFAWTSENYHDFSNRPDGAKPVNHQVFESLKPSGIFYVEDHNAKVGSPPEVTRTLHRIDVARARQELRNAGFWVQAETDHLRNSADAGDVPAHDPAVLGKTDRFGLKLRRP